MTLHSRIAVLDPTPLRPLAEMIRTDLLRVSKPLEVSRYNKFGWPHSEIGYGPGNGFDAWFWIEYREDGPLRPVQTYFAEMDEVESPEEITHEYCQPGCVDLHECNPPMAVEVNFDTSYGWTSGTAGCGDLHAFYIARIGAWLNDCGIRWSWYDEFVGEFKGDDLDALTRPYQSGRCFGDPSVIERQRAVLA